MVAFERLDGDDYQIDYVLKDVNVICNQEKCVPATWITADGSDVTEDFIRYARPLIQGEVTVPTEDGVPKFAYRKQLLKQKESGIRSLFSTEMHCHQKV